MTAKPLTTEEAQALEAFVNYKPEGWKQQCTSVACYLKNQHPSHKNHAFDTSTVTDSTPIALTGWAYRKALFGYDLRCVFRDMRWSYKWQRERKGRFASAKHVAISVYGRLCRLASRAWNAPHE